jgi:Na+/melibiose symporter-like transporter
MRDFRLLWLARAVTAAGDWLLMIALPVHVLALTGSTLATSAVFLAELLPALLLGSVAGVLVDRWDRRRTLIAVNCAHAALLLPLLLLDRPGRLWLALAVAVLQSFLARLAGPAAFALLPTLVRTADLPRTNALLGLADAMARLGGAPLGGLVYAAGGLSGVVLIDASSFLAAAALAAAIRVGTAAGPATADPVHAAADAPVEESPLAEAVPRTGLRAAWVDGLRLVRGNRPVGAVLAGNAIGQLAQGLFLVLFVVFVERSLHGGGTEIGLLRGLQAIGAAGGGALLGVAARRVRPSAQFGYGLVVIGLLSALQWNLPAASTWLGWYALTFALSGLPAVALSAGAMTIAQTEVPASHLGRVAGLFESTSAASMGLGVLLAGLLGDVLPLTGLLDAQAALLFAAGALSLALLGTGLSPRPAPAPAPAQSLTG